MADGLSECAESALAKLEVEVLQTLSTLCVTVQTSLELVKAQKELLKDALKIQLIPQQAKQAILDQLISGVKGTVQIIPASISSLCPDLATVNLQIQQALQQPLQKALDADFTIKHNLSVSAQLDAEINKMDVSITFFKDLNTSIQKVIQQTGQS